MPRTITIDPITRVQGHARVDIDIADNGTITQSIFKVMDYRGWETFVRGMSAEMLPAMTSRICGTCSASHHLAAVLSVDSVFGVTAPRAAQLIRSALHMAHFVHSHAVHLFMLAAPDLLPNLEADQAWLGVGPAEASASLGAQALRLKSIGRMAMELIGGRGTHPVSFVIGGLASPLGHEKRKMLQKLAGEGLEISLKLIEPVRKAVLRSMEKGRTLRLETCYLSMIDEGRLAFSQGNLRLVSRNGRFFDFDAERWREHLIEEPDHGACTDSVTFRVSSGNTVPFRVGPLSRINCCDRIDTPHAGRELRRFREWVGFPCHETLMYHYARGIELLYAIEKLCELMREDEIASDNIRNRKIAEPRGAAAVIEDPRGILIHDYDIDSNGIVTGANLLAATQMNLGAINRTAAISAGKYLNQPDEWLLDEVSSAVRCYDPCLSCASHRTGEVKLEAVVSNQGRIVRTVGR